MTRLGQFPDEPFTAAQQSRSMVGAMRGAAMAEPKTDDHYELDAMVQAYPGRPASAVLMTMTVRYGLPVLDSTQRRRAVSEVVDTVFERYRCVLIAFVYLPNEIQLLAVPWGEAGPARISHLVKLGTAKCVCRLMRREDPETLEALRRGDGYYFWSAPEENTFLSSAATNWSRPSASCTSCPSCTGFAAVRTTGTGRATGIITTLTLARSRVCRASARCASPRAGLKRLAPAARRGGKPGAILTPRADWRPRGKQPATVALQCSWPFRDRVLCGPMAN